MLRLKPSGSGQLPSVLTPSDLGGLLLWPSRAACQEGIRNERRPAALAAVHLPMGAGFPLSLAKWGLFSLCSALVVLVVAAGGVVVVVGGPFGAVVGGRVEVTAAAGSPVVVSRPGPARARYTIAA
jgi:hypothetical protein